ncbi:MAG: hemerythrin domain-containing protein [Geodermatophilaceae bacterium]
MCNYCGCREFEAVALLTAEHGKISNLSGEIRRAVAIGDHLVAAGLLGKLYGVLEIHDAVEELSLYPAMARHREYADKIGTLFDQHDELDQVVQAALTATDCTGPSSVHWPEVLGALQMLTAHIDHEEHGVFPAAAVCLDPADWEYAAHVRAQHTPRREQPTVRSSRGIRRRAVQELPLDP